ncbi:hypothetical protein COU91_02805 [Candidatus Saccharibacteria bacterium CG10_big_fil_rev_8_21_14_0_10_47_8]|nr:MAG: hypothetical protein COU91_02805 [Candidatus Saccharibacteria bacterium CG10_big_fil_rev_8_21_14_0_10_47_8]
MKNLLAKFILVVMAVGSISFFYSPKAIAATNYSNLMDDSVFDNSSSMSADKIDEWLNTFFPSSCISSSRGFQAEDPIGYNPTEGFKFGGLVSAGKVIGHAAQAYDLNPQVLIATLQKEQSLITGSAGCYVNTPDPSVTFQCNLWGNGNIPCTSACPHSGGCVPIAVGNNCPGNCQANTEGFSKQIVSAAWKFKFNEQRSKGNVNWNIQKPGWDNSNDPGTTYYGCMTQGTWQRVSGGSSTLYDGYCPIDGQSIHLDTGATAALYRYTPHFSGNNSFDNIFQNYFGTGSIYGGTIQSVIYRLWGPGGLGHYYTARENERAVAKTVAGFADDGRPFNVGTDTTGGMVAIYSEYNGRLTDHWYIPDGPNRYWAIVNGGYRDEGVAFYAWPANNSGASQPCSQGIPVYQLWHGGNGDHFYTTNLNSVDRYWAIVYGGFVDDGSGSFKDPNIGSVSFCVPP